MVHVGLLLVLVASVSAFREIDFKHCKPETGTLNCKVKLVEVNGCLNPSSWVDENGEIVEYRDGDVKSPCRLNVGSALNFSIAFEPGFSVDNLRSQFTLPDLTTCWKLNDKTTSPCPLPQTPEMGCTKTKCPLQAGREQRYETSLGFNSDASPRPVNDRRIYQMRWKLWNNKNKKYNCCVNIPVQY